VPEVIGVQDRPKFTDTDVRATGSYQFYEEREELLIDAIGHAEYGRSPNRLAHDEPDDLF
jgi:hypothetical protein